MPYGTCFIWQGAAISCMDVSYTQEIRSQGEFIP